MPQLVTGNLPVTLLVLAGIVLLVVVGTLLVKRTRDDLVDSLGPTRRDPIEPYREAFESGLMDEAEYRRICESLNRLSELDRAHARARSLGLPTEGFRAPPEASIEQAADKPAPDLPA